MILLLLSNASVLILRTVSLFPSAVLLRHCLFFQAKLHDWETPPSCLKFDLALL